MIDSIAALVVMLISAIGFLYDQIVGNIPHPKVNETLYPLK